MNGNLSEQEEKAPNARTTIRIHQTKQTAKNKKEPENLERKKNVAKNFNYYFGLAHKTHELHNKGSPDAQFMPRKLERFPKSKSTFYSR